MEIALLVLAAISLFINVVAIVCFVVLLIQSVRDMRDIRTMAQINTNKISGIDKLIVSIHTFLVQEMMEGPLPTRPERLAHPGWEEMGISQEDGKFITEDGIHSASSFEELIGKITKDPRYRVNRPEDIDEIRQKFDEFNKTHGEDFGDEGTGPDGEFEDPEGPVTGDEWKDSDGS